MEEDKSPSPEEITNFNNGYILSQFAPEILETVFSSISRESESLYALGAGLKRHNEDKFDNLTKSWQNKLQPIFFY